MTARDTTGLTTVYGCSDDLIELDGDVERITCPECGGSGLVDYYAVGADCPCMTCGGGLYERGRGWIDTTDGEAES